VIAGIEEEAQNQGLYISVIPTTSRPERKKEVIRQVVQQPWAGIIAGGCYLTQEEWIQLYEETKLPIVVMNTLVDHPRIASIKVDFERAAFQAIQHLLDMGHTRIVYLGDYANEFSAAEFRGVEQALTERGYTYPVDCHFSVAHTPEGASQGVSQIVRMPPESRPTAIMTFDDEFAINVINALRYYKLRIPEDISVVGFDNIQMSAFTYPALTTIDVPKRRIGRQMVLLLKKLLENGCVSVGYTIVSAALLVRDSTGPVPTRSNS
jgi:DNA-binding LacI/PurR family transcriptional regulator